MPVAHWLLAIAVVAVWGTNFVVIAIGLERLPPFLFAALRFAVSALPCLMIARPRVRLPQLAGFGVLLGGGQFGFMFLAMHGHISPGLASLLMQANVPFTVLLAHWVLHEPVSPGQVGALAIAGAGLALVALHSTPASASGVSALGVGLTLLAALCWALANLVVRTVGRTDILAFMVWSSIFSVPPLLAMSALFDPPGGIERLRQLDLLGWAVVLWQAAGNTLFGYGAWNWLLGRHRAATVTPAALLIPVFGMSAAALLLHEPLPAWKLEAAACVIAGVGLNAWLTRRDAARVAAAAAALSPDPG